MVAMIYGKSGAGKTVNSTRVKGKKNLLLCSDNSSIVLNNFDRKNLDIIQIEHWCQYDELGEERENFKHQFKEVTKNKIYDNIIIDNISDLFDLAILELEENGKFKDPRQAYQMVYQDIKRLVRKAGFVKSNIIFTAWHDVMQVNKSTGEMVNRIQPKIPIKILDNVLGLCNVVAYINSGEDKKGEKQWWYNLQGSDTLYAKDQLFCRTNCKPENIFEKE